MEKENNHPIDDLLIKYLAGMADASERESVLSWMKLNTENRKYFDELRSVYELAKLSQPDDNYDIEASLMKVKARHYKNMAETFQKNEQQNKRQFRIEILKYAALILFIMSLGIVGYRFTRNRTVLATHEIWNTIDAPFGSRVRLTLADGTKVWLNAGSQLRYSSEFAQNNRKVYLNGEAFFDVAKDENNQFIVNTPHLDVKVFGTQFNIKAYGEEDIIQTTLVEGSITIEGKGVMGIRNQKVVLKPNETATFYISEKSKADKEEVSTENTDIKKAPHRENLEIIRNINPIVFTSWKDSRWLIDGETLSSLAIKLERRYNVKIAFATKELQNYKFRGTIKDETLEQVLGVIKLSAPIEYSIVNNVVELSENKSFKNIYDDMLIKK